MNSFSYQNPDIMNKINTKTYFSENICVFAIKDSWKDIMI